MKNIQSGVLILLVATSSVFLPSVTMAKDKDLAAHACPSRVIGVPAGEVTSLIVAMNTANSISAGATIRLEAGTYAVIYPGLPSVTGHICLKGAGADVTTIAFGDETAAFIRVALTGRLTIDAVTITDKTEPGLSTQPLLENHGKLVLGKSIVSLAQDGALLNADTAEAVIVGTEFSDNGGPVLGAIENDGKLVIKHSQFIDNGGPGYGAIFNTGELKIKGSIFSGNGSDGSGGAIDNKPAGKVFITNSTFADNFVSNDGGAVSNEGEMKVTNSTFSGNRVSGDGSAAANVGTLKIVNSTFYNNDAFAGTGAIVNGFGSEDRPNSLRIVNATISGNSAYSPGGGLANAHGVLELQNAIVAGNHTSTDEAVDCYGAITSLGHNVVGDVSDCDIALLATDQVTNPQLDAYVADSQPGRGHFPLLVSSPAIDAANNTACPATDQLGNPRMDGDGNGDVVCDAGAIEYQVPILTVEIRLSDNRILPFSNGRIWVAIVATEEFDPLQVNIATVRFGPDGATAIAHRARDVNKDGLSDLLLQFKLGETGIACGDAEVKLTGATYGGDAISGTHSIRTQCHKKR